MQTYFILIFGAYFIFLIFLLIGWYKISLGGALQSTSRLVSVIIPFRNEAMNLPSLIRSLAQQRMDSNQFEVILVDDHSTDTSFEVLTQQQAIYPQLSIQVWASRSAGKKEALTTGILKARGEIILTTDADCVVSPDWIKTMTASFDSTTKMVVGVVQLSAGRFFDKLQAVEFLSIMISGLAMLGWQRPIMCNGASLGFLRDAFLHVKGYEGNAHIPSGDDEFLMRKMESSFPGSVRVVQNLAAGVTTKPAETLREFIHQRLRWAGKWRANESRTTKLTAVLIWIVQLSWLALPILYFVSDPLLPTGILLTKLVLEALLIGRIAQKMRQPFYGLAFLTLQIIYPMYVIYIGLASQFVSYQWKDRIVPALR